MGSVWKRIQRVGKKAAKFEFFVQLQSLTIECKKEKKWVPAKLLVLWQRGVHRRKYSRPFNFQPGIAKPYRGVMVWAEPEELETVCTLYKDDKADAPYEPKEWTFIVLDESSGRKKPIAQGSIDMAKYATIEPSCKPMTIKMKSANNKVDKAHLDIALHCVFLREGKATDEDMLSVASMMSLNEIDDFDFDEDNRAKRFMPNNMNSGLSGSGSLLNDSGTSSLGESFNSSLSVSAIEGADISPRVSRSPSSKYNSQKKLINSGSNSPIPTKQNIHNSSPKPNTLLHNSIAKQNESTKHSVSPQFVDATDKKGRPDQVQDLLEWCQKLTSGHRSVKVTNMTTSWRSGLAFCAILHHFHPELVDFSSLSPHNIKENNKLAFDAFDYLGVPKILDPNDMVRAATPDRLTVMTYLHQIKHHFENKSSASSINTLVSQYKFINGNEDIFTNTSKTTEKKSKLPSIISPKHINRTSKKSAVIEKPTMVDKKEIEIDEITDSEEINCIFEKMKLEDKQQFQQKTLSNMGTKTQVMSAVSIDEDEMLNNIIGTDSPYKQTIVTDGSNSLNNSDKGTPGNVASSLNEPECCNQSIDQTENSNPFSDNPKNSNTLNNEDPENSNPFIDNPDNLNPFIDESENLNSLDETDNCKASTGHTELNPFLSDDDSSTHSSQNSNNSQLIKNIINDTKTCNNKERETKSIDKENTCTKKQENLTIPSKLNKISVSSEECIENKNTSVGHNTKQNTAQHKIPSEISGVGETSTQSGVIQPVMSVNDNANTNDKTVFPTKENDSGSSMFNLQQDKQEQIQERARQLITGARLKAQQMYDENQMDANVSAQKFMEAQKKRDRVLQERLDMQEDRKLLLRSQANELLHDAKGPSTFNEHGCPSPLMYSDRNSPISDENPDEIIESKNTEFKKNPFTLVKKKVNLKPLPADKYLKQNTSAKVEKNEMESLVESRKVNLDSFSKTYQQKPKRDVAAEVAAELARMKEEEKAQDETDAPPLADSEDEEEPVPVDDYFYELEDFHLRSVDEYFNIELATLEKETKALDKVAQKLELELRKAMAAGDKEEEKDLLQEWFNLVNKKNNIIRRQDEIAFLAQADDLEKQCEIINRELRVLSGMQEHEKTEETHRREEHLVSQLVTLVNQRNDLVQIEDKQLKESAQDEQHVQQVLSQQTKSQRQTTVGSMVGWVRGIKSKLLN